MADKTTKLVAADPASGVKVNAGIIAQPFRDEIKQKVEQLKAKGIGTCRLFRRPSILTLHLQKYLADQQPCYLCI
jgi:hypothetical protein